MNLAHVGQIDEIDNGLLVDHDLDDLLINPNLPLGDVVQDMYICTVQIQPRKPVLDYADYTAPTRQHELEHTDQEFIFPAWHIIQIMNCGNRWSVR